ncbi:hypothetical protein Dfri01_59310 [Dyadobacter frigoris]|nr:hypothetical protein Dfri01_59310 [Dyadobacter frigoris]
MILCSVDSIIRLKFNFEVSKSKCDGKNQIAQYAQRLILESFFKKKLKIYASLGEFYTQNAIFRAV